MSRQFDIYRAESRAIDRTVVLVAWVAKYYNLARYAVRDWRGRWGL